MASTWRLQQYLPTRESGPQTGQKLTASALVARAPQLASIVLGVAIAAQAVAIALSLWGAVAAGSAAHLVASSRARDHHRLALGEITAAHLFGAAPLQAPAAVAAAVNAPLVLTGTLATSDPRDGFAIVGTSADKARTVYVGSEAAPGTVLVEVYPRWVVLQRGGERLKLHFPRDHLMAGGPRPAYNGILNEEAAPAPETADDSGDTPSALRTQPTRPPMTDDAAVLSSFALVATTTTNGQQGMRIAGTAFNKKTLAELGLHSGEVIVQVNGAPIGSPNGDLNRALQSGQATLTVIDRGGDETSVTVDAGSLASAAALYRQADSEL